MSYLIDNKPITPPLRKFNKGRRNYTVKEIIIHNNFCICFLRRSSCRCALSYPYPKKLEHTDYSPGRKEQLIRDLRLSNTEEQIMKLFEDMLAENIKKGWKEVE